MRKNPFISGPPVEGENFIDREDQLTEVFERLRTGQSTLMVGEPHIGKTSFLLNLRNHDIQSQNDVDKNDARQWIFSLISGQSLQSQSPIIFWDQALIPLLEHPGNKKIARLVSEAKQAQYEMRYLQKLFETLHEQGKLFVLLIDEVENLLSGDDFQDPSFFGILRDLCTIIGGIALVISSRYSISELNKMGPGSKNPGSPYLNFSLPILIPPFGKDSIEKLLQKASPKFSTQEAIFIERVAGSNPYLLQVMSSTMFKTPIADNRIDIVSDEFHDAVEGHFDDLWKYMSDSERTVSVILAVKTLDGRTFGNSFNYGEIERVDRLGLELRRLAKRGLAKMVEKSDKGWIFDSEHFLIWQGEKWALNCEAFAWWVRDVIISRSRDIPTYEQWLYNQRYLGLITQKQWEETKNTVQKLPTWAIKGVAGLARTLWNEIFTTT